MADGSWPPVSAPVPSPNEYSAHSVIPIAVLTMTLSTLSVALRFWSRAGILRVVGVEDWFILTSLVFALATSSTMLVQLGYGVGRHTIHVSQEDITAYFKSSVPVSITYSISLTLAKVSILCLYIRILTYDRVRLAAKILLGIVVVTHLWVILGQFTMCVPIEAFWDATKREGAYCHGTAVYWSHAGLNITTDFMIFTLPLTVLRKLKVHRREKIALYLVFLLAFGVCIISIGRSVQLAINTATATPDLTWDAPSMMNWNSFEMHAAVMCACLPTIKPALTRIFPGVLSSRRSAGNSPQDLSVETVGRARQRRVDPLDMEATPVASRHESEPGEKIQLETLAAREGGQKPVFPERVRVRPEKSHDSLGSLAVAGHSVV